MMTGIASDLPPAIASMVDAPAVRCPACSSAMRPAPRSGEMGPRRADPWRAQDGRRGRKPHEQYFYCVGCNAWLRTPIRNL